MKKIAVVDGLGGGLGAQIVSQLKAELGGRVEIYALGTNANATDRMVRAGADRGATGENAIRVSIDMVDFIVAPIGAIIPDAMMGEIPPRIARSVFRRRLKSYPPVRPGGRRKQNPAGLIEGPLDGFQD